MAGALGTLFGQANGAELFPLHKGVLSLCYSFCWNGLLGNYLFVLLHTICIWSHSKLSAEVISTLLTGCRFHGFNLSLELLTLLKTGLEAVKIIIDMSAEDNANVLFIQ